MNKSRHGPRELRRLLAVRKAEKLTFKQLAEQSGISLHELHHRAHRDDRADRSKTEELAGFVEIVQAPPEVLPAWAPAWM
jgi:transcriptional regulator with XRE-family HTH domain